MQLIIPRKKKDNLIEQNIFKYFDAFEFSTYISPTTIFLIVIQWIATTTSHASKSICCFQREIDAEEMKYLSKCWRYELYPFLKNLKKYIFQHFKLFVLHLYHKIAWILKVCNLINKVNALLLLSLFLCLLNIYDQIVKFKLGHNKRLLIYYSKNYYL